MSKKSIRFFNDREVRAVWDDENSCWWFSATDVVRAINDEPGSMKCLQQKERAATRSLFPDSTINYI